MEKKKFRQPEEILSEIDAEREALLEALQGRNPVSAYFERPTESFPQAGVIIRVWGKNIWIHVNFHDCREESFDDNKARGIPDGASQVFRTNLGWNATQGPSCFAEFAPRFNEAQLGFLHEITPEFVLDRLLEMKPGGSKWEETRVSSLHDGSDF